MYTLNFQNNNIQLDKFVLKNSSMAGDKIVALFDTEEDLALYSFYHGYYGMKPLSSVCSYNTLYSSTGKEINDKGLENIIEKYLPDETQKINKRKQLCSNKFVSMCMNVNNWKVLTYWVNYHKEIIKNMPIEQTQQFERIKIKSNHYIETIFNNKSENKRQMKI